MFATHTSKVSSRHLRDGIASLLLYRSVLRDAVGEAFVTLLDALQSMESDRRSCLHAYGRWFEAIAATGQSWHDWIVEGILTADNPFSRRVQHGYLDSLPTALVDAVRWDLAILQQLYRCDAQQIARWVHAACQLPELPVAWELETVSTSFLVECEVWADAIAPLAEHYRTWGVGIFARFRAFGWQQGELVGIAHPDRVRLDEIVGYEEQKAALVQNTQFLLAGYPALHVLLYGSRGSGKSSLVKALLHEDIDLRLVEVSKSQLRDLPLILERLRDAAQKFIIFVDDLSFEEDDEAFKALKVVLEGSVTARASNVVVYATSNRRHLIREYFSDRPQPREQDEVHAWDTMQEKLSFSDRFGLTLTFQPPDQGTYLHIVQHLAAYESIHLPQEELEFRAKQWATRHNGRSGRTARQFIDFLRSEGAIAPASK